MARDLTANWELPTTRTLGGALPISAIDRVQVELSGDDGATYGNLPDLAPTDPQQAFVPDLEPGVWLVRVSVFDTAGTQGVTDTASGTVPDDSPPAAVVNLTVTIS
jgi:hypothetical protein